MSYDPEWPNAFSAEENGSPRCWAPSRLGSITTAHRGSRSCREADYRHPGLGAQASADQDLRCGPRAARIRRTSLTQTMPSVPSSTSRARRRIPTTCMWFKRAERGTPDPGVSGLSYATPGGGARIRGAEAQLAPQYNAMDFSSRQAYADGKVAFVTQITGRALAEGYPHERRHGLKGRAEGSRALRSMCEP